MLVVVLVLGNPDVSQSEQRNKIIAGQIGSFRCRKGASRTKDDDKDEDESKLRNLGCPSHFEAQAKAGAFAYCSAGRVSFFISRLVLTTC